MPGIITPALLAVALLAWSSPVLAQGQSSSGFGGMSSGGFGGSSSGGFGGSSSGGFGGSSSGGFGGQSSAFGSSSSGSSGGGFSGGNAFGSTGTTTGSSFRTTTGAGAAATGTTTYNVSTTNLLATYYGNPTAMGAPGLTGQGTFGQPVYNLSTTTTGSTTSGITGSFGSSSTGMQGGVSPQTGGFSPITGQLPVTYYVATLGFPHGQQLTSGKVLDEVRQVIARSSSLPSNNKIRVLMTGDTVILQGSVSDEHERRLAAALVSLTPGVHGVSNELKVQGRPFLPTLP